MKPKPTASIVRATSSASRSMRAPRASSRSADPERLVAERLPCLATAQPAPAAISAAVVETLKVLRPPPVPAVSSRCSARTSTLAAKSRIVRASPATSSTVSPFVRRAIRKAAISTSEALPSMISASTAAARSWPRSWRRASRSTASLTSAFATAPSVGQEVRQQPLALRREHRLGVKLHALGRQLAVAQCHQHAVAVSGGFQAVGQLGGDDQRVIAPHHEGAWQAGEDRAPVVLDRACLAVDRAVQQIAPAEGRRQRLVAEADPERGHRRLGQAAGDLA